ncbi:zinc-binding metallopeptidase family protein [Branchiibius cervicis]|uniref:Zinc-binding metallopeptidase n=1 Tax=Branchiibius cervicis TaxID=908252 RepID=A0ABW2AYI4_9MICO
MRSFGCPRCRAAVSFEALTCPVCGARLGYHPPDAQFYVVQDKVADVGGIAWSECGNRSWGCNWLVDPVTGRSTCAAATFVRKRPEASDPVGLDKLADTMQWLRRLLYQLQHLGLPMQTYRQKDGALAFDLLSSITSGQPVTIGHANGVIQIDLAESLDDQRERLRIRLGEPYRTMLGHLRHEVGHYYQSILVEQPGGARLEQCRDLFGDERTSYSDEIARHYKFGAPQDWRESYISEYATMHPWEDFAECFAHYLHISDTMETAAASGMMLSTQRINDYAGPAISPRFDYSAEPFETVLSDWDWLQTFFNRINRSMGKKDLYPFEINDVVARKLAFIHQVVASAQSPVQQPA